LPNVDAEAIKVIKKEGQILKAESKLSPDKQNRPKDDYYSVNKNPASKVRQDSLNRRGEDKEEDLENMKMRTMIIDLSQQKVPPAYSRLLKGIKVFGKEYICDCFSCTLIVLFFIMLAFVIVSLILTKNKTIVNMNLS
jgi:hypothetical protein